MATQLGMAIDEKRCVACTTCAMACKIANNLSNDMWWNSVVNVGGIEQNSPEGTYPALKMSAYTLACQHCAMPACMAVCPVNCITKREDGIVMQDLSECIGCQLCIEACPYKGVRTFLEGEPLHHLDFPIGDEGIPEHYANTVEKCTFCSHRVDNDEEPACIVLCPGRARVFGDVGDPESEISKLIAARSYRQLQVKDGTGPSVYILE